MYRKITDVWPDLIVQVEDNTQAIDRAGAPVPIDGLSDASAQSESIVQPVDLTEE